MAVILYVIKTLRYPTFQGVCLGDRNCGLRASAELILYRYCCGIYHHFDSFGEWYGNGKCGNGKDKFDCLIDLGQAGAPIAAQIPW